MSPNGDEFQVICCKIKREFGHLDGILVNAGYSVFLPFEEVTEQNFDKVISADFKGVYFTIGEVLVELSMNKIGSLQLLLAVAIRFHLVHENGALLTTMASQISLTVSVDIEPADTTATMHWIFPDRGMYAAPFPHNVLWKSDVHR